MKFQTSGKTQLLACASLAAFLLSLLVAGVAQPQTMAGTETDGWATVHVPLFLESGGYHSVLTLNNNRPEPIQVEVGLFGPGGGRSNLIPLEVPALMAAEFPLADLLQTTVPFGSVQVRYAGLLHEVAAQVTVSSTSRRVSFESVETHGAQSTRLDSILWVPNSRSKATVALTNLSDSALSATLATSGRRSSVEIRLKARETRLIDTTTFVDGASRGNTATILTVEYDGQPGEVAATGFVVDVKSGFSSTLAFSDAGMAHSSRLSAADCKLGRPFVSEDAPADSSFDADLALANRGDAPQKARVFVATKKDGFTSRIEAARVELDPMEAEVLDLDQRLEALGIVGPFQEASLDLFYDGPPGSLIAKLSSYDHTGDHSFDSTFKDPEAAVPNGGSYPWRLDGARRTVVHLKNTTDRSERAFLQIRWPGGFYTPAPIALGPWESASLDLERIRASREPDVMGVALPPDTTAGQLVWYSDSRGALIGRAEVRNDGLGMASSFSCEPLCCGLVRDSDYMVPSSVVDVVGNQGNPFTAEETRRDCHGIVFGPYDMSSGSQWASSNSSVASVSGGGHVSCLSAGTAGITASFSSIVAFTTYPSFCFAVVAGGVVGASILVNDPTVTITNPPNNPTPSDSGFSSNFSFLSNTQVSAQAVLSEAGDTSKIQWNVVTQLGGVTNEQPSSRLGPSYSFRPNPPAHPSYLAGTSCSNPGHGSCARSAPLSYAIGAAYFSSSDTNTITQDQKDIIRQEYLNHGLSIAARLELTNPQPTTNFSVSEVLAFTSYSVVLGQPASFAQTVRDEYNKRIRDDVQVQPVGTTSLASTAIVVSPGQTVQTIGAILDTQPCRNAPNPATCDDQIVNNNIVAGPNGKAETEAYNETTSFGLTLNSAWRNPQRNEAVGGLIGSSHQFGNAIDLDVGTVAGKTSAQLFCILQTAADAIPGANGFAERNATQIACNDSNVTHVHVQK